MDCPFCDELATMQPPQGYDGDVLDCPKYGRVKIARSVLGRLKAMNLHCRVAALTKARAKAEPGAVPEISSIRIGNGIRRGQAIVTRRVERQISGGFEEEGAWRLDPRYVSGA